MIHKWFHKFVRKRTKPIPEDSAILWKRRLSLAYGFFAWNAFGYICYMFAKGKGDWAHYHGLKPDEEKDLPPARSYAQYLGIKNAQVYRMSGLKKVDEYTIENGEVKNKLEEGKEKVEENFLNNNFS